MKKKRFTKKRIKALLHKVIPYILVGVITSSAVIMSYEKAREVKAVAGVDDIALIVALMAMAGIAYTGTALGRDSTQEERQKFVDDYIASLWNGARNQATGGDGDPDNDDEDPDKNKFPTWANLKETVAKCGGRVDLALGATAAAYITGALGHIILKSAEEGAKKPYGLPEDFELDLQKADESLEEYCFTNKVDLLDYPYTFTRIKFYPNSLRRESYTYYAKRDFLAWYDEYIDGKPVRLSYGMDEAIPSGCIETHVVRDDSKDYFYSNTKKYDTTFASGGIYNHPDYSYQKDFAYSNFPIQSSLADARAFWENPHTVYPDEYINPSTIGQTSALKDMLKETDGKLEKGLHNAAILPTTEQLNKYFQDLKNALNEEEKQEVMDEFVRSLTDPVTDPNPNPNPDPDPNPNPNPDPDPNPNPNPDPNPNPNPDPDPNPNPNPNPNPDPDPDNPGDNTGDDTPKNESFLADLKHLFPFCIPFDLVDCFRLFNAEPVTPRVEVPVHFGIINYDHTFVFDLSDFNGVASVCRSMFLILYMVGLILATRALIKG